MQKEREIAEKLARRVAERGGRAYYVGGVVRDGILGRRATDVDVEVHGLEPAQLEEVLDVLGPREAYGASFGIYSIHHTHLDVAMPRKERAIGEGHRDFRVDVDPHLGPQEAARRRDFTINALMQDVLTGEILDFFGGLEDLRAGVLRHVDGAHFGEDPLRVLRAAQFSARGPFEIAPETLALCRSMDLTHLARERVMEELKKALFCDAPSRFFEALRAMDQLSCWFAEVERLIGVAQDPAFHPEGDAWTHTLRVLDAAARLREGAKHPLALMLGALCHDLGKPETTVEWDGHLHAYGHEKAGVSRAEALLGRLSSEKRLIAEVLNLVALHMRPGALVAQGSGMKAYMRLFDEALEPDDLLLLVAADRMGTGTDGGLRGDDAPLREALAEYERRMAQPYVTAANLRAAGIAPGPIYARTLDYAHRLLLSGVPREEAIHQSVAFARRAQAEERKKDGSKRV